MAPGVMTNLAARSRRLFRLSAAGARVVFTRLGAAAPGPIESRDECMGIDTPECRRQRQDPIELARPQEGVDALKDAFEGPTEPSPGVVDTNVAASGMVTRGLSP
jgi:hypothetical protein